MFVTSDVYRVSRSWNKLKKIVTNHFKPVKPIKQFAAFIRVSHDYLRHLHLRPICPHNILSTWSATRNPMEDQILRKSVRDYHATYRLVNVSLRNTNDTIGRWMNFHRRPELRKWINFVNDDYWDEKSNHRIHTHRCFLLMNTLQKQMNCFSCQLHRIIVWDMMFGSGCIQNE